MCKIPWRLGALSLGLALLAACDRDTPVAPDPSEAPADMKAAAQALIGARPQEAEFHRLSREIDGYGGHYFDEAGDLVVHLADPGQESRARQLLAPVLDSGTPDTREAGQAGRGSIRVQPAEFTFPQLSAWRDRATQEVLPEEGVEFIDLDEVRNRVVVGVSTPRGRMAAARTLQERGVPAEAILFEEAEPVIADQSLRDYFRPLRGGFQITGDTYNSECTLGFNATWNGQAAFLTNSHCTRRFWRPDSLAFYQPAAHSLVGHETFDPPGFLCVVGSPMLPYRCRWSDAAVIKTSIPHWQRDFGYIARTTSRATGLGNAGSLTVDPSNPRMQITGHLASPSVNQLLHKIGRTTGWTYGRVDRTCVDVRPPPNEVGMFAIVLCQTLIKDMHSYRGDSGSPVFRWHGDNVTLAGLHWAQSPSGGTIRAVMSPMANLWIDLGYFHTH